MVNLGSVEHPQHHFLKIHYFAFIVTSLSYNAVQPLVSQGDSLSFSCRYLGGPKTKGKKARPADPDTSSSPVALAPGTTVTANELAAMFRFHRGEREEGRRSRYRA